MGPPDRRKAFWLSVLVLGWVGSIALLPRSAVAEGKLERVRDAISAQRQEREPQESSQSDADGESDDDHSGDTESDYTILEFLLEALFSTTSTDPGDGDVVEPPPEDATAPFGSRFAAYPYAGGYAGNLFESPSPTSRRGALVPIRCPLDDPRCLQVEGVETCVDGTCYGTVPAPVDASPDGRKGKLARFRLSNEGGVDVDGLLRYTAGFWLESAYIFGLEGRFSYWLEPLSSGVHDYLILGDFNLVGRLFKSRTVQLHLGVGSLLFFDPLKRRQEIGYNTTLAFEAYPTRPITLRGSLDVGQLGEAPVVQAEAAMGAMFQRVEVYAGYSGMRIGPVAFHGPLVGVRLHL